MTVLGRGLIFQPVQRERERDEDRKTYRQRQTDRP